MATAWLAPEGFDPPEFTVESVRAPEGGTIDDAPYFRDSEAYIERLAAEARRIARAEGKEDPIIGEVIRWSRGDGFAEYMVWRARPLQLIHLNLLDGYSVEEALIRGLRIGDVRAMVAADKRLRELFSKPRDT
jgi:hypothetical protein